MYASLQHYMRQEARQAAKVIPSLQNFQELEISNNRVSGLRCLGKWSKTMLKVVMSRLTTWLAILFCLLVWLGGLVCFGSTSIETQDPNYSKV